MNFLDWMNMNMVMDIAFIVFTIAIIHKLRNLQNKISLMQEKVTLNTKNPEHTKRLLKENQQ